MRAQLQLRNSRSDEEVRVLLGKKARAEDAGICANGGDVSVFKPTGERLLTVLRAAVPDDLIAAAFPVMWEMRKHANDNRGTYTGEERVYKPGAKTGRVSAIRSVVLGAMDRNPRIPYCRQTALTTQYPEQWGAALPFIQHVAKLFQQTVPDRYAAQLGAATRTHAAYVLPETPFTTVTVNNTVAGAYHTDKGDYAPGFGAMVYFRRGKYNGGELVFPKYGVSYDARHGDVVFFDPHEVHGVVPFRDGEGREGEDWVRLSMVFYFRSRMEECLAPAQELERAKALHGGGLGEP
jgi:hypothetical protein